MKTKSTFLISVTLLSITALILGGCTSGSFHLGDVKFGEVRIGMMGSNSPRGMAYQYRTFSGFEQGSLETKSAGSIDLEYDVAITKGSLTIQVMDPSEETLWEKDFDESAQGRVELEAEQPGRYQIFVQADDAGGSFELTWDVYEVE